MYLCRIHAIHSNCDISMFQRISAIQTLAEPVSDNLQLLFFQQLSDTFTLFHSDAICTPGHDNSGKDRPVCTCPTGKFPKKEEIPFTSIKTHLSLRVLWQRLDQLPTRRMRFRLRVPKQQDLQQLQLYAIKNHHTFVHFNDF